MDLPIKGASVQMKGLTQSVEISSSKLPIVPYLPKKNTQTETEKCSFCTKDLEKGEKHAVLPCGHRLQYCCLEKWSVIVQPCRACRQ